MANFFDNLEAAARQTANKVNTKVAIAAQEQAAREAYQDLGRICYRLVKNGTLPENPEFAAALARADDALARIRDLKSRNSPVD